MPAGVGKPVVIERLVFRHKNVSLEGESRKYRRMLSSFSYGKIKAYFLSLGYRLGVEVHRVNPAFSTGIDLARFREHYGFTVYQAATVLGRSLLACS